jgi:hypothetical protein
MIDPEFSLMPFWGVLYFRRRLPRVDICSSLIKLKISLIEEGKVRIVRNSPKSAAKSLQISPEVRQFNRFWGLSADSEIEYVKCEPKFCIAPY